MKVVSLFLILLLSLKALATEDSEAIKKPEYNPSPELSSEQDREGKRYLLGGQMFGVGPNYSNNNGLIAGYYLDSNSLIILEILRAGAMETPATDNVTRQTETKGSSLGASYKVFTGNSFYWMAGLVYRSIERQETYANLIDTSHVYQSHFKGTSTAITMGIGNQWQWENFTLGCDWVGFVFPISSDTSEDSLTGNPSAEDRKDYTDRRDRSISDNMTQVLRFYLGASF